MAQFPFAHTLTMTYRLSAGVLEVRTRIDNLSAESMPVAIGFHPYFQLTDSVRKDWTLDVGARRHWLAGANRIPTGESEPADTFFGSDHHAVPLSRFADRPIDDAFGDLERDQQGRSSVILKGRTQSVSVLLGPKFKALLIFSTVPGPQAARPTASPGTLQRPVSTGPAIALGAEESTAAPIDRGFVAIEPMAAIPNALNAAHQGWYKELQSIAPGDSWQESFWIATSGY
jgi:aldose 1-epimerase